MQSQVIWGACPQDAITLTIAQFLSPPLLLPYPTSPDTCTVSNFQRSGKEQIKYKAQFITIQKPDIFSPKPTFCHIEVAVTLGFTFTIQENE